MPPKPSNSPFLQEIRHHSYLFAVVILFPILLQVDKRLLRIDKERIAAEPAHLKTQIYQHFLFNTLNSIYALTIRKDDKAPDSIVKLAEFMRYICIPDFKPKRQFFVAQIGECINAAITDLTCASAVFSVTATDATAPEKYSLI